MASSHGPIFIVGNSRSGTTLVSKMLDKNEEIYCFTELHFFEKEWVLADKDKKLSKERAIELLQRLATIARHGIVAGKTDERELDADSTIVREMGDGPFDPVDVYRNFLYFETRSNHKIIPCEQTPRYIFYLGEILELFPNAKIILMLRDPRDILLSQKNKWRQYGKSGERNPRELLRAWANYHPVLIAQMWTKAMQAAKPHRQSSRVQSVQFEQLLSSPGDMLRKICDFLGVEYTSNMLDIAPSKSSLSTNDGSRATISTSPIGRWKNRLPAVDVYFCEKIAGNEMEELGYNPVSLAPMVWQIVISLILLPLKAFVALLLNLGRNKNIFGSIRRRLVG